ncbi:MAG TPA: hypothetical protein DCP92_19425 [Nitrospiraceae bacterium]|jgi:hypothetical protein|nr:hypothetical protein [Nitrospiraceae bacterium]
MRQKITPIGFIAVLSVSMWIFSHGVAGADDKSVDPSAKESEISAGETGKPNENRFLPSGNLFRPLIADPKELRFYLSYRPYQQANQYLSHSTEIFAGSLGDMFGLYRFINSSGGYNWQANISGGVYSEFDIKNYYLVDVDYFIGFPFTFRKGPVSYRINFYHQSSHVGDEYLLHSNITRIEFSYEAINLVGSYEWTRWRVYYGGEVIVQVNPSNYKPVTIQSGLEYYGSNKLLLGGRFIGGLDLKCTQENDWPLNTSVKAGLQFDESGSHGRSIRFLLEGYKGFSPYGQFFNNRLSYIGLGVTFEYQ